ncbi:MAG: hypothetical protein LBI54_03960, partial [Lachnospiraceae bacterium]|jgi:ribosomal protein L40E|nr:hypothetical protein [Lachnospiraceae bacterium]
MEDFFSFRKMVSPVIIKVVYVLGGISIVVAALTALDDNFLLAVLGMVLGELLWRVICEGMILLFQIHSELVRQSGPKSAYAPAPAAASPPAAATPTEWVCPVCNAQNAPSAAFCKNCGHMK